MKHYFNNKSWWSYKICRTITLFLLVCCRYLCYFSVSLFLQPGSSIPKVTLCIVKVENTSSTPQKWEVKPPNTLDGMYVWTSNFPIMQNDKRDTQVLMLLLSGSIISYQPSGWAKIILTLVRCGWIVHRTLLFIVAVMHPIGRVLR